jgi:hypothetical protein
MSARGRVCGDGDVLLGVGAIEESCSEVVETLRPNRRSQQERTETSAETVIHQLGKAQTLQARAAELTKPKAG